MSEISNIIVVGSKIKVKKPIKTLIGKISGPSREE